MILNRPDARIKRNLPRSYAVDPLTRCRRNTGKKERKLG